MNRQRGQAELIAEVATLQARVDELERMLRLAALQGEKREQLVAHAARQLRCIAQLSKLQRSDRKHAICTTITDELHWSAAALVCDDTLVAHHNLTAKERKVLGKLMQSPQLREYTAALSTHVSNAAHLALTASLGGEVVAFVRHGASVLVALDRQHGSGKAHHTEQELAFLQAALALVV